MLFIKLTLQNFCFVQNTSIQSKNILIDMKPLWFRRFINTAYVSFLTTVMFIFMIIMQIEYISWPKISFQCNISFSWADTSLQHNSSSSGPFLQLIHDCQKRCNISFSWADTFLQHNISSSWPFLLSIHGYQKRQKNHVLTFCIYCPPFLGQLQLLSHHPPPPPLVGIWIHDNTHC